MDVKNIYEEIMNIVAFLVDEFCNNNYIDKLKCHYCQGNLSDEYGKFGPFVFCDNYPQCRFSFNI